MTEPDPITPAVKALDALLVAIDGNPTGPALTAYRAAIRRHGVNIADTAGANGLRTALERVAALAPQHAEDRRTIVSAAWTGLPDWTPTRPEISG